MENIIIQGIRIEDFKNLIKDCIRNEMLNTSIKEIEEVDHDHLLKIEDVQKFLNVSKVTIHKWKKAGLIPYLKMNRSLFFRKKDVLDALKSVNVLKQKGGVR